jgi:ABC-type nitrate/sulfonate/bicarbonate transport system permease component
MAADRLTAPTAEAAATPAGSRNWRPSRRAVAMIAFIVGVLAIWQVYSLFVPPVQVPSPGRVAWRFYTMWSDSGFLLYAGYTLQHVAASVTLAFTLALAIALLVYFFPVLDLAVYGRLAPILNSFPGIGWAFLALIWLGINSQAVIFSATAAMLPLALINIGAGLRELNREAIEMSVSFSRNPIRRVRLVILPMLFPYLFAALRLCFGVSFQIVLIVELLCGAKGLGSIVNFARSRYWTDMIFAVAILILVVVYLVDRLVLARLQDRIGKVYNV